MMQNRRTIAVVSAVEGLGSTLAMIEAVLVWPGLTDEQRVLGARAILMGAPIRVDAFAAAVGLDETAVIRIFRGSPLEVCGPKTDREIFPSQDLAYGRR